MDDSTEPAEPAVEKRRLSTECELFLWGNSERDVNSKIPLLSRAAKPPESADFSCDSCHLKFTTAFALQLHHTAAHECQCRVCGAALASCRILEMHISEFHDAFFAASVQRGDRMYQCLAPGCSKVFKSKHGRTSHMVMVHKFPQDFASTILNPGSIAKKSRQRWPSKKRGARAGRMKSQFHRDDASVDMEVSMESSNVKDGPQTQPP